MKLRCCMFPIIVSLLMCTNSYMFNELDIIPKETSFVNSSPNDAIRKNNRSLHSEYVEFEGDWKQRLEPIYGECEYSEIQTFSTDAEEDEYENNNSFLEATNLTNNTNKNLDYSIRINATLHRNEWLWGLIKRDIDEDYYRFDILGNANVSIDLTNIPYDVDYDLELYKYENIRYADKNDISFLKRSTYVKNYDEHISVELEPGTYYLRVYPYGDSSFDAQNKYSLLLNVKMLGESVSISNMRFNKGAKGAIWVSDYDPFGIKPYSTMENPEVGVVAYDTSGTSLIPLNVEMYQNPFFTYMRENKNIPHTTLYIWDETWRKDIYDFLNKYEKVLTEEVNAKNELKAQWDRISEITGIYSTALGLTLSLFDLGTGFSVGSSIFGTLLAEGPSIISHAMHPEIYSTTQDKLLEHIRYLKNSFERSLNPELNEVIKVSSFYNIETEEPLFLVQWNYHCNFNPKYDQNGYSTMNDNINYYSEETIFNGKTYPLRNYNDMHNALNRKEQNFDDINTGGDEELLLDNEATGSKNLIKGQYQWYHFTAPERGKYRFYSISDMDTYVSLFDEIVPGISIDGRVAYDDDSGALFNYSIIYSLYKGQTIYLRVSGYGFYKTGSYTPMVSYESSIDLETKTISPNNYGYNNEYVDVETKSEVILDDGFTFSTTRYRCGFINKTYLALSAKRNNHDTAYLELDFGMPIYQCNFSIGLWSSEEYINSNNSYILFQYANESGKWIDAIDFDIDNISRDKDALDNYSYEFSTRATKIRFYVHTNQVNYEKNKGRVVIGNIAISY